MEVIKGDFSETKGIPPSGLCVGVHRAGAIHQKMVQKHGDGLAVWSLRPDLDFIAFKKQGLGEKGTTVLLAAVRNGLQLRHDCTEAICGTDRVKIVHGKENLSEKSDDEELTLEMIDAGIDDRLACVARVLGDVVVEIST